MVSQFIVSGLEKFGISLGQERVNSVRAEKQFMCGQVVRSETGYLQGKKIQKKTDKVRDIEKRDFEILGDDAI